MGCPVPEIDFVEWTDEEVHGYYQSCFGSGANDMYIRMLPPLDSAAGRFLTNGTQSASLQSENFDIRANQNSLSAGWGGHVTVSDKTYSTHFYRHVESGFSHSSAIPAVAPSTTSSTSTPSASESGGAIVAAHHPLVDPTKIRGFLCCDRHGSPAAFPSIIWWNGIPDR